MRWAIAIVVVSVFAAEVLASPEIHVRAKRQQCRCIRNQAGGLTCSCGKPDVAPGSSLATAEHQQQNELAYELQSSQPSQARCACLQIVFMGNPQYQCHCGDINGNPLPTTTTTAPTTTTTTPTTTTTTSTTTTTPAPTLPPTTATPAQQPVPTTMSGTGQCQCIMIRISGPASAHYQCNCQNTPEPDVEHITLPTPPPSYPTVAPAPEETTEHLAVYPPVGTVNATTEGCFCVDPTTYSVDPHCGCLCDCTLQLCTQPMAVSACPPAEPQHDEPAANPVMTTLSPATTLPPTTLPPTTLPPTTQPPVTLPPVVETTPAHSDSSYPLTTTCVMYVGVQATPCTCLPQYDQCAQNICCLKAKYRSYKNMYNDNTASEPSTIDMLMSVLQKLKNRLE